MNRLLVPGVAAMAAIAAIAIGPALAQAPIEPAPMLSDVRDQGGIPLANGWPDGPGRDRVVQICGGCHGTSAFPRRLSLIWSDAWDAMPAMGMRLWPDEVRDEVLYYLMNYRATDHEPPAPGTPGPTGVSVGVPPA